MSGITTTALERVATATAWTVYIITLVVRGAIVARSHTRHYRIFGVAFRRELVVDNLESWAILTRTAFVLKLNIYAIHKKKQLNLDVR